MGSVGYLGRDLTATQERHMREQLGEDYHFVDEIESAAGENPTEAKKKLKTLKTRINNNVVDLTRKRELVAYINELLR